jgi:hypothetical protein
MGDFVDPHMVPMRKSMSGQVPNFKDTQEEDVQVVAQFKLQKKQFQKKVASKKKMVKVEEGEEDEDEESKEN